VRGLKFVRCKKIIIIKKKKKKKIQLGDGGEEGVEPDPADSFRCSWANLISTET